MERGGKDGVAIHKDPFSVEHQREGGVVPRQVTPTGFKMTRWMTVAINRVTPTGLRDG